MKTSSNDLSRRHFLRQACCSAVGTTGLLSALSQLRVLGAVAADSTSVRSDPAALPSDYKALVCLFLNGGNDGNSVIVPYDKSSYSAYAVARGALAIDQAQLLPISPRSFSDGHGYALHPALSEMNGCSNKVQSALLANVGTLVQPTTLAQYKSGKGMPPQLFSHIDQLHTVAKQHSGSVIRHGWGGPPGGPDERAEHEQSDFDVHVV